MLTGKERIEILMMFGYGENRRNSSEVCALFNAAYPDWQPIVRSTVSNILKKFTEYGHVRDLPRTGRITINENTQLNVLMEVEDNHHVKSREIAYW